MRLIWASFALIAVAATAALWMFAAGWSGTAFPVPSSDLLSTGEWPLWVAAWILFYGPPLVALWCAVRAIKEKSDASD
jgi:hypothetical protein